MSRLFVSVMMALLVLVSGLPAAAQQPGEATTAPGASQGAGAQEVVEAREVQTVWTSEFGIARPAGLAYEPSRGEFLVAADGQAATRVLRLGPDEDRRGVLRLPPIANPDTLAFDESRGELTAVDDGARVEVPRGGLTGDNPQTQRTAIGGLDLDAPSSATFDARTGTWYVLEEGEDTVTVVAGTGQSEPPEQLQLAGSAADRVIAFNTSDELLYVMDPERNQVNAVDRQGNVDKRFSLASVDLATPVAMTFAPSTDPTDDRGILNLFVADSGDERRLGGVTEVTLAAVAALAAPIDTATLVRTTATSGWSPGAPDPSGVTWLPAEDKLAVVDSEVDEETGAGWNNVNFWRANRLGAVTGTGALWGPTSAGSYSREPTGLDFDAASNTLFVSDDSAGRVFVVKRGPDGLFATTDDVVTSINTDTFGNTDTEDPEFDPGTGHLFLLDGVGREIYRVNPVDGTFGNGNDTMTHFDISHLGPTDFEGLTAADDRDTLYVGARASKEIFEITNDGTLVRTISAAGVSGLRFISGLAVAPASNDSGQMNLWIVDRAVDNGADENENDGKLFEISAPNIGGGGGTPSNQPPVAVNDTASTSADMAVPVAVLTNDSDPNSDPLTVTNLTQPANGTAQRNPNETVTYTPDAGFTGTDTFTYTANDGQDDSNVATVTVTVTGGQPPSGDAPAFRSAASAIVTGASGTTLAIARPTGVQAGDLLLAQIRHRSTGTLTAPAGWTHVGTIARSTANHGVYYKIATASEPASYAFNQGDNTGRMAGGIGAYTGVHPTSPINAWAASAVDTATLVAPTATSTVDNTRVVRLWGWRGPSVTTANAPPAGVTERWSQQTGHANDDRNRVLAGDHVKATAGAVGTSTASGSTNTAENRRSAFTVILAPAGGGGTPTNEPPVAVDDTASTTAGTATTVSVLNNDSDPDDDSLTVTNLTQPANGTAQRNPNETVTYTPNGGFTGTDTFTYTANDGQDDSNVATVTVTVTGGQPPSGEAPAFRSAASAIVTGASGTTLTITRPTGVQAGDLLLAQIRHRSLTTLTPPAGWTHVGTITQSTAHHGVYYKIATAAEPASYAFNQGNDGGRMAGGIGAYTGVNPTAPINAWAASAIDTATLVAPTATSTVDNTRVVRLWGWRGPSVTTANAPPAGVTERWSQQIGHANDDRNRVLAGDHVKATAGAVGTATASGSTNTAENRRNAFTVILAPAGG